MTRRPTRSQLRRHARRLARDGYQPMMVINSGTDLPETAATAIARTIWRYRSELAPLAVSMLTMGAAWWAHADWSRWWELILAGSSAGAALIATFGARLGIESVAERTYTAAVIAAIATVAAIAATAVEQSAGGGVHRDRQRCQQRQDEQLISHHA